MSDNNEPTVTGDAASRTARAIRWPAGWRGHVLAAAVGGLAVLAGLQLVGTKHGGMDPSRNGPAATTSSDHAALANYLGIRNADVADTTDAASAAASPAPVDVLTARLAARLETAPDDAKGWRMLGWSYFATQRYAESAAAYAKAVALLPDDAALRSLQGEAVVRAAGGTVTADAEAIFKAALGRDGKDPRARFFLGLGKEQAGDKAGAFAAWKAILADASGDEDWVEELRRRTLELGRGIGADVAGMEIAIAPSGLAKLAPLDTSARAIAVSDGGHPPVRRERGPTAADVKAASQMSEADRAAMIRGMVDGLQQRLEAAPNDADGWIKLMRSRMVLGETVKAEQAYQQALKVFDAAPDTRARIETAARHLGVVPGN